MSLPARWTPLRAHAIQQAYWTSPYRFNVLPAGRRSGKTELAKRKLIKRSLYTAKPWSANFFAGAPTRDQAKRIFWDDLKAMSPRDMVADTSESELCITYINANTLWVVGLDKPQRIEGSPWDGGVLDEYANMKSTAWGANVRPALSDRAGWCDLIGVPEGRNHYYDLYRYAMAEMAAKDVDSEWGAFTWISADILPPDEIIAAKAELDPLTYAQEYEASFVNFTGRAYYTFIAETHAFARLRYNPKGTLALCFDFNVEPGVAAMVQEQRLPRQGAEGTGVIDEVRIPRNSNTPAVCRKILEKYGNHEGRVVCYGDATGGARGSAKVSGSDWDLIEQELRPVYGQRLSFAVKGANPAERSRVNAVNSRCLSAAGHVRMMVDPTMAPYTVKDFEGVVLLEGGSGEIDKKATPDLTHLSDAIGYYIEYNYPVTGAGLQRVRLGGT